MINSTKGECVLFIVKEFKLPGQPEIIHIVDSSAADLEDCLTAFTDSYTLVRDYEEPNEGGRKMNTVYVWYKSEDVGFKAEFSVDRMAGCTFDGPVTYIGFGNTPEDAVVSVFSQLVEFEPVFVGE
jgi:hypothetical protein